MFVRGFKGQDRITFQIPNKKQYMADLQEIENSVTGANDFIEHNTFILESVRQLDKAIDFLSRPIWMMRTITFDRQ